MSSFSARYLSYNLSTYIQRTFIIYKATYFALINAWMRNAFWEACVLFGENFICIRTRRRGSWRRVTDASMTLTFFDNFREFCAETHFVLVLKSLRGDATFYQEVGVALQVAVYALHFPTIKSLFPNLTALRTALFSVVSSVNFFLT